MSSTIQCVGWNCSIPKCKKPKMCGYITLNVGGTFDPRCLIPYDYFGPADQCVNTASAIYLAPGEVLAILDIHACHVHTLKCVTRLSVIKIMDGNINYELGDKRYMFKKYEVIRNISTLYKFATCEEPNCIKNNKGEKQGFRCQTFSEKFPYRCIECLKANSKKKKLDDISPSSSSSSSSDQIQVDMQTPQLKSSGLIPVVIPLVDETDEIKLEKSKLDKMFEENDKKRQKLDKILLSLDEQKKKLEEEYSIVEKAKATTEENMQKAKNGKIAIQDDITFIHSKIDRYISEIKKEDLFSFSLCKYKGTIYEKYIIALYQGGLKLSRNATVDDIIAKYS